MLGNVRREPTVVVGMLIPWNFPLHIACRKGSAALAAGNTVVLKAPELAPLTCLELGRIALEAGVPPGGLDVGPGVGATAGAGAGGDARGGKIAVSRAAGEGGA